jgi:crossover junction endodeoxyribonuclease RusA
MSFSASIFVPGPVESQGSKRAYVRGGRAVLVDDSARLKPWRATLSAEMHAKRPPSPVDGPVSLEVVVYVPRPKAHFGTGRNAGTLKAPAPEYPATGRDIDKVARAVFDAGTGI